MATDSSAAGYLLPSSSPVYGNALDDLVHGVIVGLTGITGDLVRPRWQPEPPQQPDFTVDWVAFGLVRSEVDTFAYDYHDPTGNGVNAVQRDELLYFLHSFYGPDCHMYCEQYRDGLEVAQNRDALTAANIGLQEVQEAVMLPALLKEKWVKRIDVTVVFRRRTTRTYPVLTIQSGQATLDNEHYLTPINVTYP